MEAFKRFDFENDDRWMSYLRSVELPAGDSEAVMLRVKARWYKRTIDPDFDISTVGSAPKTAHTSTPSSTNGTTYSGSSGAARTTPSTPPPPPPPPRYGQYGSSGSGAYGDTTWQIRLFFMHLGMLLLGAFVVLPFMPFSRLAYRYLMRLTIVTFGAKIYLQHGLPSIRPLSIIMAWVQRVLPTADFMYFITAFTFSGQPPMLLVVAPTLVLAAYHAAAFAAAHFGSHPLWARLGRRVHALMLQRQPDALQLNAAFEVVTLFLLVAQLLTPARNLLTLMFYTQILKLKLHAPDSALQHRTVWRTIDRLTLPYRQRVPTVERVIQMAANWFMTVPGAR